AAALREAKAWLRNLTRNQIAELGGRDPHLPDLTRGLTEVKRADKGELAGQKPFAHPHHWAPFVVTGDPL
ncbi:MAG: hypothetical protein ACYS1C_03850, partial [Planctomycetota bacterium]